jgi:hypothetical protein
MPVSPELFFPIVMTLQQEWERHLSLIGCKNILIAELFTTPVSIDANFEAISITGRFNHKTLRGF